MSPSCAYPLVLQGKLGTWDLATVPGTGVTKPFCLDPKHVRSLGPSWGLTELVREAERAGRKPSGGCRCQAVVYRAPIKGCAQAREPHRCVVCRRSGITDHCAHLNLRYTVWSVSAAVAVWPPVQRFSVAMRPYVTRR